MADSADESLGDGVFQTVNGAETGEKPLREKLKKTSITGLPKYGIVDDEPSKKLEDDESVEATTNNPTDVDKSMEMHRGRSQRKRSFDDLQKEAEGTPEGLITKPDGEKSQHRRKRSRDVTSSDLVNTGSKRKASGEQPLSEEEESLKEPEGSVVLSDSEIPRSVAGQPDASAIREKTEIGEQIEEQKTGEAKEIRRKRSRDQFDKDSEAEDTVQSPDGEGDLPSQAPSKSTEKNDTIGSSVTTEHKDKKLATEIPSTSGFANTSAVSPFATLANSKSPSLEPLKSPDPSTTKVQTSASAFAASGFSKLASSGTSPFGALGSSSTNSSASPFGAFGSSGNKLSGFGSANGSKPGVSSFGGGDFSSFASAGASGASPFGAGQSGFATLGSSATLNGSLTSATGSGGKSWATPGGSGIIGLSEAPAKEFGAPDDGEDDEGESEEGGSDAESQPEQGDEEVKPKDEKRFHLQEVETGEEGETTLFSCRGKLFYFNIKEKAWKERGIGIFKLNMSENETSESEEEPKKSARLIMRADGSHRLILNSPVLSGMKFGDANGDAPTGTSVSLAGMEDGKPVPLLLRTRHNDLVRELYERIIDVQAEL